MSDVPKETINISNKTVLRVIALVVVSFLFLRFLSHETHVIALLFTAFFLALALNPAVSWIAKHLKSKSRIWATATAYLTVLVILITLISLIFPPLIRQSVDFINNVPSTLNSFETQNSSTARFVRRYKLDKQLSQLGQDFKSRYGTFRKPVLDTAGKVGSSIVATLAVFVLTFMMLVEGPSWLEGLWKVVPQKNRQHNKHLAARMYRIVTGYVNGQVLIAAIAATFALITLVIASTLFGVSLNAVALAGIVFLFGLIPLIGNTLAAVIVVLICLFSSFGLAAVMTVYFLLYQQIENVTLYPYIQSKFNELTPLLVFSAALVGANFGGLFGAFVAIPTAGCLKLLIEDYIARHNPMTDEADK